MHKFLLPMPVFCFLTFQVMNGGQITQSRSYEELLTDGKEQLVNAHRDSITGLGPSNNETKENLRS